MPEAGDNKTLSKAGLASSLRLKSAFNLRILTLTWLEDLEIVDPPGAAQMILYVRNSSQLTVLPKLGALRPALCHASAMHEDL